MEGSGRAGADAPLEVARAAAPGLVWSAVGPARLPALAPPAMPLATLRRALARAERPVLLVNDGERRTPPGFAEALAELWQATGERADILVATGTHRADPARERDRLGGLPVGVHDAEDAGAHVALEVPGGPTPGVVGVDRRVARADLIVALGSVEPHYFAGWTGAHKTASIGVLDRASIERNHRGALEAAARPTALEGNPVFDGIAAVLAALEAAEATGGGRRAGRVLCVNHVLDPGTARPVALGAGTWRGALARCLPAAAALAVREVPAPVDVLVARVRGPLGRSLYQADKGLKNTEVAVRDGGALVLDAPMDEGVGDNASARRFVALLAAAPTHAAALAEVARAGYRLGDHKAVRWRALEARGVQIHLVAPGLAPEAVAGAGLVVHADLSTALAAAAGAPAVRAAGQGLVVEEAGETVVCVAGG